MFWPLDARPATCCWMIGVAVTTVMVSAVVLPSGAVVVSAVTEHDPPFLSQVATVKSSAYFAMFSKRPPTVWNAPAPERLEVGVQVSPLIVGGDIAE